MVVSTLVEGDDDYCLDLEKRLRPTAKIGWNIQVGGGSGWLGLTHSQATKDKLSAMHKGRTVSEETKHKMSKSSSKNNLGLTAWLSPSANIDVWLSAETLFELYASFQKCAERRLSKASGVFDRNALQTIVKKFKSGWIPAQDTSYLLWLTNQNKECPNGT